MPTLTPQRVIASKVADRVYAPFTFTPLWGCPTGGADAGRYDGAIWRITTQGNQGDHHDYVIAPSPKAALDLLADAGLQYARKQRQQRPNLSLAHASSKLIARHQLEPAELIPLGAAHQPHVHGLIISITPMMGWEMPADTLFAQPS